MARRPPRRVFGLVLAGVLAACSVAAEGTPSTTGERQTRSAPSTTITTPAAPTTTSRVAAPTSLEPAEINAEVVVPEGDGPFPGVVLVHGGGWVTGDPSIMDPLADYLNANGFLTVNTRYTLATLEHPGFPAAIEDVGCAVRFASTHPDSDGSVAVIGHSAGAHIGAIVALTGDDFPGSCPYPGSGMPDRFIGLAGPYDVSKLGLGVAAFFGAGPDRIPEVWDAGNPLLHASSNPELHSLIMYGDQDGLVSDRFAVDFHAALVDSGGVALLERVEGATHNEMHDPSLVGDLIVTWLGR